ncbi:MAG: TolC family protein, partial [Bacteroidales bacterium]|nr:TolC family protein [Bacteroidales bacterium]
MKHILLIVSVVLMFADCFAQNSRKDKTVADLQPQQQTQSWQQIFPDPLLQNYIAEALDSNSDLRIAQLALEQSEAMLKSAKLSYLPSFSFAPSAAVSKAQGSSSALTYELPVTMNWELNFGGKQHYQKEMAKLQLQKDTAQLKYARIQIIAEMAN